MKECINDYIDYNQNTKLHMALGYNLQFFADDAGDKTEPATEKKLKDARDEGKVAKSKELTASFDLIVLFLVLKVFISYVGEKLIGIFSYVYDKMPNFLDETQIEFSTRTASSLMMDMIIQWMLTVLPFFVFGVVVTLLVSIIQVGWKVSTKPLQPKLSNFNPINGFKRIFSKDSLFELVKSILKIGVIAYVAYTCIVDHQEDIFILYDLPLKQAVALVGDIIINTGLKISLVYLVVGIADFIYNKYKFNKDMKMTKQEVKDEFKNTEGDPEIKGRQKRRMQEASQRRMMQDVPKADVVITNPTHFAVAIRYDSEVSDAPIVVAKGQDFVAQKIKEIARENNVEIVENKPLARMLFHNVDIGAQIPPELYQSVAEILAMIYKTKNQT